jgi:hypothetical protein
MEYIEFDEFDDFWPYEAGPILELNGFGDHGVSFGGVFKK